MQNFFYLIIITVAKLRSLLPFRIMYVLSDVLYVWLYFVFGYRKKVVKENLEKSFPEKSKDEISKITKAYFHHLCDLIYETIKLFSISEKELIRRCRLDEDSKKLFQKLFAEKKSLIIITAHTGNWEWCGSAFSLQTGYPLAVIYRPIKNKAFNKLMHTLRTRFGNELVAMNEVPRFIIRNNTRMHAMAFISDQTPPPEYAYWTKFLNQDTPLFTGAEKIAARTNRTVIYFTVKKEKRGFYTMSGRILSENPAGLSENELTEMHVRLLEKDICEQPENWLWSHRRWKHQKK